jgi:Chaperone of endosialidase
MVRNIVWCGGVLAALVAALPSPASAQTIGTFKWQLQPFCNVVTLAVSQVGGVYRLEGTDDQCGNGADRASAVGTAFPNPDGTIGFGLTVVATPGGVPVHVDAALAPGGFDGTWKDSAGNGGAFRFTAGAGTGGAARPLPLPPAAEVPAAIGLRRDGGVSAVGAIGTGANPATGAGVRMTWHPGKAAFRAGAATGTEWDDANVGLFSLASGNSAMASGEASMAVGERVLASGRTSVAGGDGTLAGNTAAIAFGMRAQSLGLASVSLGYETIASGVSSVAAGSLARAIGANSLSFGQGSDALNTNSVAIGFNSRSRASGAVALGTGNDAAGIFSAAVGTYARTTGSYAVAAGTNVTAEGGNSIVLGTHGYTSPAGYGSMVLADGSWASGLPVFQSFKPNELVTRFAGGYFLHSNTALTAGVRLPAGASAWSALSDASMKENFRDLVAEDVLAKIAAMPVREWNYTTQAASIRHVGPTAQDFHAAFGLGEDPLRISTIDADGVALAGVRALEARTQALRRENLMLRSRLDTIGAALEELRAEGGIAPARAQTRQVERIHTPPRPSGDAAGPAPSGSAAAGFAAVALAGFDWMTPILAAIGLALAWLLVARGPFV